MSDRNAWSLYSLALGHIMLPHVALIGATLK